MHHDQRIIELEFLAQLARRGGYLDMTAITVEHSGAGAPLFKDLILSLLLEDCVTGAEPDAPPSKQVEQFPRDPHWHLWRVNETTFRQVLTGRLPLMLRITHLGLVRLARLREELDRARVLDPTRILIDRRYVERDLRIRLAMRSEGTSLSLLMGDLDHFKAVNDRLGHPKGTEALQRYFSVLRDLVSSVDGDAYRFGGDETFAILAGLGEASAKELAESFRSAVQAELTEFGHDPVPSPTVSIGVLTLQRTTTDTGTVLDTLDKLLYKAKERGRNRVEAGTAN
jgi:diguanylate cyclase (GGDEF)-like protein